MNPLPTFAVGQRVKITPRKIARGYTRRFNKAVVGKIVRINEVGGWSVSSVENCGPSPSLEGIAVELYGEYVLQFFSFFALEHVYTVEILPVEKPKRETTKTKQLEMECAKKRRALRSARKRLPA